MATYKGIGYDTTNGRTRTGAAADTVSFNGLVDVTGDASVGGDLTVTGDIVSRGTSDLLVQDNFIDLNQGNTVTAALAGGYTVQMNRNASFTANNVQSFSAGAAGDQEATRRYVLSGVPANTESITLTHKNIAGVAVTYTINFVNAGSTSTVFSNGQGVTGTASINRSAMNAEDVNDALLALFQTLTDYYTVTEPDAQKVLLTGKNNLGTLDMTVGGSATGLTYDTIETGNGTAASFVATGGTAFTTGEVAVINNAADSGNDGFYIVSEASGTTFFIYGTNGFTLPGAAKFAQTSFAADTTVQGTAFQPDLYIQAVSDGSNFNTPAEAKGVLLDTYDAAAELGDYTGAASWAVVGASAADTTLQEAYDAGATITTDATGAIAFTFDTNARGFTMDGDAAGVGDVTMGATTTINTFTVDAAGAISLDGAAASNLATTSGALTLTGAAASTWSTTAGDITVSAASGATDGTITLNAGTGGIDLDITSAGSGFGNGALTVNAAAASTVDVAGANLTLSTSTSGTLAATSAGALTLTGAAASTWSTTAGDLTISAASGATDGTIQLNAGSGGVDIDITSAGSGFGNGALTVNAAASSTVDVTGGDFDLSTTTSGSISVTAAQDLLLSPSREVFYCIGAFESGENLVKGNPLYMEAPTAASTGNITFTAANLVADNTMLLRDSADANVTFTFTAAASTADNIGIVSSGLKTISINADGTGYSTGNVTLASGNGVINITSIGGSGEITGVSIVFSGSGYSISTGVAVPGGGGNATIDIDAVLNAAESNNTQAEEAKLRIESRSEFSAVRTDDDVVVTQTTLGDAPASANTGSAGCVVTNFSGGNNTRVKKADASAISTARIIGFAQAAATSPATVKVAGPGSLLADAAAIGAPAAANIGAAVYLSETAGAVTVTPPTATNAVVYQVGFVVGNTTGSSIGYSFQPQFVMEIG
ncbi:hypothetical protein CMI47_10575 [Candidatus Pacearchaeota archaeon]|nr:hypothetical protein [Candidatus Pacearchaeota archaeon]